MRSGNENGLSNRKYLVAEDIEQERQVVGGNDPHRLDARDVEQPVGRVQRRREQRARPPFEAVDLALADLDDGAAVPGEHVKDLVVEMARPIRGAAGRNVDHVERRRNRRGRAVGRTPRDNRRRAAATARSRPREIDRDALDDRHPLARRPFEIGIDQVTEPIVIAHRCHLCRPMQSLDRAAHIIMQVIL